MASQSTESTPNEDTQKPQLNGSTNQITTSPTNDSDLSPSLTKKSYKSVLTKEVDSSNGQVETTQVPEKKESTDSVPSIPEEQTANQTTTEESSSATTESRKGSTSRRPQYNIGRGGQPWKRNNNYNNRRNKVPISFRNTQLNDFVAG